MKKLRKIIKMTYNKNSNPSMPDEFSLLRQIPNVQRARGFRLYLSNGKRLIDLWLNGGAEVLGHTPPNMLRELKNTASRGLYAPYPHFSEGRFIKALLKLLHESPDQHEQSDQQYSFRLYAAPPFMLIDGMGTSQHGQIKLWRPFSNSEKPFAIEDTEDFFIPVIPGIQTWRNGQPLGLCVVAAKSEKSLAQLPPSDVFSPIQLAIATRGVYDIIAASERGKPNLLRVFKILQKNTESKMKWQRKGIYLTLNEKPNPEEWALLFNKFFEAGFLLPPTPAFPLILPGELSDGEEAKLAAALTE
jgi:hypothetical protein